MTKLRKPETLTVKDHEGAKCCDAYEYSMANANIQMETSGVKSIFLAGPRELPINKVVGEFEYKGIKYPEVEKRKFIINAGLEQVIAFILKAKNDKKIRAYFREVMGWTNEDFLNWAELLKFSNDVYAIKEGTPTFAYQPLVKIYERFEEAQVFESIILSLTSRESMVASAAWDMVSKALDKVFLEGASRRATGPEDALRISRAARIGGFHFSSYVKYGEHYGIKVGGTHGHSYVLLHPTEYAAFKAQGKVHGKKVVFLIDTFNSKRAIQTALRVIREEGLTNFGFRIDSGDLLQEARQVHEAMKAAGIQRNQYTLFASDDLTAARIEYLEQNGADIDRYLAGTFLAINIRSAGFVFKLTSKEIEEGVMQATAKYSSNVQKSTLPDDVQVYRITDKDGFYSKDIIGLENEDINAYLEEGETFEKLLIPIVKDGKQVYDFPRPEEISKYREACLKKFSDIENYTVLYSKSLVASRLAVKERIDKMNSEPVEI